MKRLFFLAVSAILLAAFAVEVFAQKAGRPAARPESSGETFKFEPADDDELPRTRFSSSGLITATSYAFSAGMAAMEDMSSGTTQLIGPAIDDTASAVTPIGFDFWYDGVRHTQFSCNPNGLCRLGPVAVTTTFTNSLATTTAEPKIAPFWDDLCTGATGQVHYKIDGDPDQLRLIVEWQNMKITRSGTCVAPVGNGTFQMVLHQATGVIQFIYGGIPATTADGGYSIGLQAGAATNIASVTTNGGTVSYTTANNAQMDAIPAGTSYSFTPVTLAAPTNINFTDTTAISTTINWTDNATGEVGYVIYRGINEMNFQFVTQTSADATSFTNTGLDPSTEYQYRVYALSEGRRSAVAQSEVMTNPTGNVAAVAGGGNWSNPATWDSGAVPTTSDVVTIASSLPVTIDTDAGAYRIIVGTPLPPLSKGREEGSFGTNAILQFEETTGRTLNVIEDVRINPDGIFRSAAAGNITTHLLAVGEDILNNGVLDFSTNGDTAGAGIAFIGSRDGSFSGSGPVTDVRTIVMNRGSASTDSIVELATTNFTVGGSATDTALGNFLTLTNGMFAISGTFTGSYRTFTGAAAYVIPATAGFYLNNPNYEIVGQNGSPSNNGFLGIGAGTFNVGTSLGNSMGGAAGAQFVVQGGTMNFAGRLQTTSAVSYNQSGGVVNVCTVGQNATTSCFGLTSTLGTFTMSGGEINLVQINSNATATSRRDYQASGAPNITGGTLRIGTGATTGNAGDFSFRILGNTPSIVIDNTNNPKSLITAGTTQVFGDITIPTGTSLVLNNGATATTLQFFGTNVNNNGAINGGGAAASRFNFRGQSSTPLGDGAPQFYAGSGEFGNGTTAASGIGISAIVTFNSPVITNRVNLFSGMVVNSGNITLGNGGASATVVQTSQTGSLVDGGVFDGPPVFNTGTGGHTLLYITQPNIRVSGFEIPPSRTVATATWDILNNFVLANGDLTVTGTMTLTNGAIFTGSNTVIHNGTIARTNGRVEGKLRRTYTAPGTYTFHVGKNGYSPVIGNATAVGMNPSSLTVEAFDSTLGGYDPARTLSRNWEIREIGDITADLSFLYLDSDVNGNEADYRVYRRSAGNNVNLCSAAPCVNAATNTAGPVTGVTDFSRWAVGEDQTPSAATASIVGRVFRADGENALDKVSVTLSGGTLPEPITVITSGFGYFVFDGLPVGQEYTLTVARKGFTFTPSSVVFTLEEDLTDVAIVADP